MISDENMSEISHNILTIFWEKSKLNESAWHGGSVQIHTDNHKHTHTHTHSYTHSHTHSQTNTHTRAL